jgi:glycosyltransferase involved in cell wall biosynthesis
MNRFSIDLVICTYNNAGLLDRTLACMTAQKVQTDIDWGITIINNNCTDHTPEVVEKYAAQSLVPLRMIAEPVQGLGAARLCAAENTRRDWIAFIDDDCLMQEDWLTCAQEFAEKHPGCGAFGGKIILEFETPPPSYVRRFPYAYAGKNHGDHPKRRPWVAGTGMTLRRTALEASGWLKKQYLDDRTGAQLISGGDVEMGLRIAAAQWEVWYNPACVLRHIIPERRFSRPYLRRILFGLGAARHHADALVWKKPYPAWLLYSLLFGLGILLYCLAQAAGEIFKKADEKAGFRVCLSPFWGWCSAVWNLGNLPGAARRVLLGAAG